jgi:hypothetical protein
MKIIPWLIALVVGFLVLAGYFIPVLADVQLILVQIAMFVLAFGVLAGVINLLGVHWRRFEGERKGGGYSLVVLLAFMLPIITAVIDVLLSEPRNPLGLFTQWLFDYWLLPIETTLFAVMAVALAYFAARMLRWRTSAFGLIFFGTTLLTLIITSPYLADRLPELRSLVQESILQPLVLGGGRGILFGVALGTIATGLRVLMGADRPYG